MEFRKDQSRAKTGRKSLVEQPAVESQLTRADLLELTGFLESNVARALGESFVVPRSPIDYAESATVQIIGPNGNEKADSINGYGAAGLEQKNQLPETLIVLMDKIEEIEKAAARKSKDTKTPPGCLEALK
jgi:hypothetical protein